MAQTTTLEVLSFAFVKNAPIPKPYTCDGDNINPPLRIDNIPEQGESMVIILEDPDAPNGTFTHWMVWDLAPHPNIEENTKPDGVTGPNDFGKNNYMGPCPPAGEKHRYFFKVYVLDSKVNLAPNSTKEALEVLLQEKTIGYGELMGTYQKD
ncbi:PBP family phospholipid-binding protein [Pontibacter ummariensis]|uniref:Phospholipid-binding protein, PBP family n=1 Tax=Pontibacter ummariensis TaxID=1610492 RepID=A0A239GPK7_9BACT|nr:YbhB/YbcL family Raf kinase inhibitor-like protein [Pontibacter ummariensis]PRY11364.1 PBP family phospholipid-binding protein [Pontibacter ummariensis]SNS70815.1 phospholipid-binding protein, PBP family [Pontibacter ummariensis]